MRFKSFLRFFQRRQNVSNSRSTSPRGSMRGRTVLFLEPLEKRELLTNNVPTIISTGVLPVDGTTTPNGLPTIQIQFSEPMGPSATNPSDYLLLGSTGNSIPINSATLDATKTIVTLSYNNSLPLLVGTPKQH